jgi:outer membrane cobalamin receptor
VGFSPRGSGFGVAAAGILSLLGASAPFERSLHAQSLDIEIPTVMYDATDGLSGKPAEEDDVTQMVLSAAKRIETVQTSSSIITVVTRDSIEVRGYEDLSDLLDDVPGFEGYRPAFYFQSAEAFARGNARTTLVLWNGVPINTPQSNRRVLGPFLPMDTVDRVEVVSGPGGVLWGANAFLGIVSVSTLRENRSGSHAEVTGSVGTGARSQGVYRTSATVADSWHDGDIGLYANLSLITGRGPVVSPPYDLTIGPFPAPDTDGTFTLRQSTGETKNSRDTWMPLTIGLDAGKFRFDLLYPLIDEQYREFNDAGTRTDQFLGPDGVMVPGQVSQRAESVTMASLQYNTDLGQRTHLTARSYYTGFEDRWIYLSKFPPGVIGAETIYVTERYDGMSDILHDGAYRYGAGADVTHERGRQKLVGGGEVYLEGIREVQRSLRGITAADIVLTRAGQRLVTALFLDDQIKVSDKINAEIGARAQYAPGSYAPLVLGSAALRYNPHDKINLKLHAAQGFRPPAFELTHGNDDATTNPYAHRQANPDLEAERSLSLESELSAMVYAGSGRLRYLALRLGYQFTQLDDLIVFGPGGEPENSNRRIMNSVEARSDLALTGGHRVILGYTYLTGEDLQTGPLRNIPEHRLNLAIEARLAKQIDAHVGFTATGPVEDLDRLAIDSTDGIATASPSRVVVDRLPATAKLDLGVVARGLAGGHFDLAAHILNALDSRYAIADPDFERRQAIYPLTAPGLSAMLTLTGRM